ncbi:MAG: methyltransferase domain-containing protein [Saprospiraceae bacterium]
MNQKATNAAKKIIPEGIRIFFRRVNWKWQYFVQTTLQTPTGKSVYCPIAKQEFKAYAKIGNALITPSNGARGRQRLVWHYLEHDQKIFSKKISLLHTAPELSFFKIFKNAANIDYTAGDKMMDGYSNQSGILNIDLTDLKFEDSKFDYLLSNHVLEHIPDDKKAMSEIYRVLKPGGTAVITVPINETFTETYENPNVKTAEERIKHFGQWDHVRWYSTDIKERLEAVGFEVELVRYANQFSTEDFNKFGFKNNIIVRATRPA